MAARALRILLVGCLGILGVAAPALAQGYSTEDHPEHGISFQRPRSYEELARTPSQRFIVFRYTEALERSVRNNRTLRPEIQIVRIDWSADPAPVTGGSQPKPESGTADAKPEAAPPELPINGFERYLERELAGWRAIPVGEQKARGEWESCEYELEPEKEASPSAGWAWVWRKERARTIAVLGFSSAADRESESKVWRRLASGMKLSEPADAARDRALENWHRHYSRRKFVDPEYRTRVRLDLANGWQAEDAEHYIVVYSTRDQPLVRRVLREIESMRAEYERLFPPAGEIKAVSTVRVCKDRDEYLKYGGNPMSAGYWNSDEEELVLYDATVREKGKPTEREDTFIVLYHEAFHQYIHYSAGELAPHSWFNEGYGDYFSGAQIDGGRVRRIGPNPWRVNTIRAAVQKKRYVSWSDITRYEQLQYYANGPLCYAEGWSMVYFLETSRAVRSRPDWARILPTYFETLKSAWAEELSKLGDPDDPALEGAVATARQRARTKAVDAAFEGVDLGELERAWTSFVLDLEPIER